MVNVSCSAATWTWSGAAAASPPSRLPTWAATRAAQTDPSTAIPLICFGAAATRVPLTTLGLLQYLAPVLQFVVGVFIYDEAMPASRWIGFVLVWIALVIFTVEATTHRRRQLRLTVHASAAA